MSYLLTIMLLGLAGCATSPFNSADCLTYKYHAYTISVCDDGAVNHYCHKHGKTWDDGTPLDDRIIRACSRLGWGKRKARIWVGESYTACIPHEACHLDGFTPEACERNFPCR